MEKNQASFESSILDIKGLNFEIFSFGKELQLLSSSKGIDNLTLLNEKMIVFPSSTHSISHSLKAFDFLVHKKMSWDSSDKIDEIQEYELYLDNIIANPIDIIVIEFRDFLKTLFQQVINTVSIIGKEYSVNLHLRPRLWVTRLNKDLSEIERLFSVSSIN